MNIQNDNSFSLPVEEAYTSIYTTLATPGQFIWLCALVLSFCYELALVEITTMDRINPRPFDIVFIIGLFTVLPKLPHGNSLGPVFKSWAYIIAVFTGCALIWCLWLPVIEIGFSLFYLVKHLQGLTAIYMVAKLRLTDEQKKTVHYMVIAGGIFVALYAIPEKITGGTTRKLVERADKEIRLGEGHLLSSLGGAYFHVAMFSSLSSVMALSLFNSTKTFWAKAGCIALGLFISWPAFFCGARTGIIACFVGWLSLFFLSRASFKGIIILLSLGLFVSVFVTAPHKLSMKYLAEKSPGFQRFVEQEEKESNTLRQRLDLSYYQWEVYRWQGMRVPFIGAAFYVAPHTSLDGTRKFRHAYGIHNIYLFAFEQGGLAAFILFIVFLCVCRKNLKKIRKSGNEIDKGFAIGMHAFFHSILILGFPGQVFWQGFGTENFNTYIIILFVLATVPSTSFEQFPSEEYAYDENYQDVYAE